MLDFFVSFAFLSFLVRCESKLVLLSDRFIQRFQLLVSILFGERFSRFFSFLFVLSNRHIHGMNCQFIRKCVRLQRLFILEAKFTWYLMIVFLFWTRLIRFRLWWYIRLGFRRLYFIWYRLDMSNGRGDRTRWSTLFRKHVLLWFLRSINLSTSDQNRWRGWTRLINRCRLRWRGPRGCWGVRIWCHRIWILAFLSFWLCPCLCLTMWINWPVENFR